MAQKKDGIKAWHIGLLALAFGGAALAARGGKEKKKDTGAEAGQRGSTGDAPPKPYVDLSGYRPDLTISVAESKFVQNVRRAFDDERERIEALIALRETPTQLDPLMRLYRNMVAQAASREELLASEVSVLKDIKEMWLAYEEEAEALEAVLPEDGALAKLAGQLSGAAKRRASATAAAMNFKKFESEGRQADAAAAVSRIDSWLMNADRVERSIGI